MKKILTFIIGLFLISITFLISCEKEDNNTSDLKTEMINRYKIVGETHNLNLSLVYQDLKAKKINLIKAGDIPDEGFHSVMDIISSSNIYKEKSIPQSNIHEIATSNYRSQFRNFEMKSSTNEIDSLINNSNFSDEFRLLIGNLITISNNHNLSISNQKKHIDENDDMAIIDLKNENELNIYFCASSVAKSSFEYWANNTDEWIEMFSQNSTNKTDSPYDHEMLDGVVGADVGGAVAGALTAAVTGPVGWVAGGIIGSSAASSGKFVENVWNYFF